MGFLNDSEKNIKKYTSSFKERKKPTLSLKEVSGGGVAGFVGRGGRDIDALFAGAFHPDSGHGSENEKLLAKQVSDRKKQRAEMEKQAYEDGVELVGNVDPIGGWFADIGETEGIELAYEELTNMEEIHRQFNDDMTPEQDLRWKSTGWDYDYDEPGEAYKIKDIVYDDEPTYAGVNFINNSQINWKYIEGVK